MRITVVAYKRSSSSKNGFPVFFTALLVRVCGGRSIVTTQYGWHSIRLPSTAAGSIIRQCKALLQISSLVMAHVYTAVCASMCVIFYVNVRCRAAKFLKKKSPI